MKQLTLIHCSVITVKVETSSVEIGKCMSRDYDFQPYKEPCEKIE